MPRTRSRRPGATTVDDRLVTRVETVALAAEPALVAGMRNHAYAVWTRRAGSGLSTIQFILCA
jgi:hypothetical protein